MAEKILKGENLDSSSNPMKDKIYGEDKIGEEDEMKLIVFTKHFEGKNIEELINDIKFMNAEGADLCVRPGYPVEPETALKTLPAAVKRFEDAGLSIPIITTPGDFIDPKKPIVEKVFAACSEAGIRLIKLGYWYMQEGGYWKTVEAVRQALEGFVKLAEKYTVKVCVHNHSGGTMGLNSSSMMNLVRGFDPRYVGVFADPGHLSLVGEPLPMALDIVKEYLTIVAVKDLIRERYIEEGKRQWRLRVVPLGEGFVDWHTLVKLLLEMKFTGPVSMHSEYAEYEVDSVIDQTRMDIRFFRRVIDHVRQEIKES